jgi:hypothetical protein
MYQHKICRDGSNCNRICVRITENSMLKAFRPLSFSLSVGFFQLLTSETCCVTCSLNNNWPSPWSSGQSSWLQIQRSGFDSWCYQIFWEVVSLERGPLSFLSTIEELLGKSSGFGLESQEYGCRDMSCWPHDTLYPQKLEISSQTSGSRSIGIVHSVTQAMKFLVYMCSFYVGMMNMWL